MGRTALGGFSPRAAGMLLGRALPGVGFALGLIEFVRWLDWLTTFDKPMFMNGWNLIGKCDNPRTWDGNPFRRVQSTSHSGATFANQSDSCLHNQANGGWPLWESTVPGNIGSIQKMLPYTGSSRYQAVEAYNRPSSESDPAEVPGRKIRKNDDPAFDPADADMPAYPEMPWFDPIMVPPLAPTPVPVPPPVNVPKPGPNPHRSPREQSQRGNRAPGHRTAPRGALVPYAPLIEIDFDWFPGRTRVPRPRPRPNPRPDAPGRPEPTRPPVRRPGSVGVPRPVTGVGPRINPRPVPRPHRHRVPPAGTRERKAATRWPRFVKEVFNGITEGIDLLEAIFEALPAEIRRLYPNPTPQAMAWAVYNHAGRIDLEEMIWNIIANQIEDAVFGAAGRISAKGTRKAAEGGYYWSPVGTQAGPAI